MSDDIKYDISKKTVRQLLDTLYFYEFEGNIDDVIGYLNKQKASLLQEYGNGKEVTVVDWQGNGAYLDKSKKKLVTFDIFHLIQMDQYGDRVMTVWGERKMLPEEIEAIIVAKKKHKVDKKERDKREFDRMKKEYGW